MRIKNILLRIWAQLIVSRCAILCLFGLFCLPLGAQSGGFAPFSVARYPQCQTGLGVELGNFSNSDLMQLLLDETGQLKIQSVDDLIPLLPDEVKHITLLMYQSRSLFARYIDATNPRVILSNRSGSFKLSYFGCDNSPERCETIEWQFTNPKTLLTEFRTLNLHTPGKVQEHFNTTPKVCANCHGDRTANQQLRPLFEPYNAWPGLYGSASRLGYPLTLRHSDEYNNFKQFVEHVWSRPNELKRYSTLPFWPAKTKTELLAQLESNKVKTAKGDISPLLFPRDFKSDAFIKALKQTDGFRVARKVLEHPDLDKYLPFILAIDRQCRHFEDLQQSILGIDANFVDSYRKRAQTSADRVQATVKRNNDLSQEPFFGFFDIFRYYDDSAHGNGSLWRELAVITTVAEKLGMGRRYIGNGLLQTYHYSDGTHSYPGFYETLHQTVSKCDPKYRYLSCAELSQLLKQSIAFQ